MSANDDLFSQDNAAHGGCSAVPCYASSCGRVTLYLGDCLEILPEIEADAVVTDPPYGVTAEGWDVVDFAGWEILHGFGRVVATGSQPFSSEMVCAWRKRYRHSLVWNKVRPGGFLQAGRKPMQVTEDVLVFGDGPYNPQMTEADPKNIRPRGKGYKPGKAFPASKGECKERDGHDETKRYPTNLLTFNSGAGECNNTKRKHPTQKPIPLMEWLIKTYTNEGQTVLDPFMGSGTTGIAAIRTGRRFIGIERDPTHYATALERIRREIEGDLFHSPHNA